MREHARTRASAGARSGVGGAGLSAEPGIAHADAATVNICVSRRRRAARARCGALVREQSRIALCAHARAGRALVRPGRADLAWRAKTSPRVAWRRRGQGAVSARLGALRGAAAEALRRLRPRAAGRACLAHAFERGTAPGLGVGRAVRARLTRRQPLPVVRVEADGALATALALGVPGPALRRGQVRQWPKLRHEPLSELATPAKWGLAFRV